MYLKLKKFYRAVLRELTENRSTFLVYVGLRVLVTLVMILQMFNRNYENVFLCLLTLVLMIMPSVLQVTFKIEFPSTLEVVILLFIFAAEILGEISSFYMQFKYWDTVLHTLNGFVCAGLGFSMVDILNRQKKLKFELSPLFMAIMAFCFSMTIGVLWEFFEYAMDMLFGLDMQKDTIMKATGYVDIGLIDTMNDLIVNFIGATIFSIWGYIHIKHKPDSKIRGFVPTPQMDNKYADIAEDLTNDANSRTIEENV